MRIATPCCFLYTYELFTNTLGIAAQVYDNNISICYSALGWTKMNKCKIKCIKLQHKKTSKRLVSSFKTPPSIKSQSLHLQASEFAAKLSSKRLQRRNFPSTAFLLNSVGSHWSDIPDSLDRAMTPNAKQITGVCSCATGWQIKTEMDPCVNLLAACCDDIIHHPPSILWGCYPFLSDIIHTHKLW